MVKVTSTLRGDIEKYVMEESERTGFSTAVVMVQLAIQGMEYKQGLRSLVTLTAALENDNKLKGVG